VFLLQSGGMQEMLFTSSTHTAMGMLVLSPVMQVKLLPDDMPLVEMMSKVHYAEKRMKVLYDKIIMSLV
jgi:hypothetical protein